MLEHEFAGRSSFVYNSPGFAALKLNSGVTAYVRADLKAGKNISGQSVSAALRYQF